MRAVNLLPREETRRERKSTNRAAVVGLAGAVILSAVLGAAFLSASSSLADKQDELAGASARLAALPKPEDAADATGVTLTGERDRRAAAVASALSYHVWWDRLLRRFALVLPDDVWLTSLAAKAPRSPGAPLGGGPAATGGAPSGFTISGYTYSHESVARLLSRLSVVPDLRNVQLQTSTVSEIGERRVIQFTILADVRGGGSAS